MNDTGSTRVQIGHTKCNIVHVHELQARRGTDKAPVSIGGGGGGEREITAGRVLNLELSSSKVNSPVGQTMDGVHDACNRTSRHYRTIQ